MTITGAVGELNKEIERLTKIRDSLLQGLPAGNTGTVATVTVPANASKATKKAPAKKRVISAEARRKMSEASKARWAAKKAATKKSAVKRAK
jgi:hypothetical protein